MTTITAIVPLLFQLIASEICQPGQDLCFEFTPAGYYAEYGEKVNLRALYISGGEYMETKWLSDDIMKTTYTHSDGSSQCWINDLQPVPCEYGRSSTSP